MVKSVGRSYTLHPLPNGRLPGSPLSETDKSDDGVCTIPIAVPKAKFRTDRSGERQAKTAKRSHTDCNRTPQSQTAVAAECNDSVSSSIIFGGEVNFVVPALDDSVSYTSEDSFSSESETLQMAPQASTQASTAVATNDAPSSVHQSLRSASPRFDAIIDQWRVHKDEVAHLSHLFQVEVHTARLGTGTTSFSRQDLIDLLDQAIFLFDAQESFDERDHRRADSDFDDAH